MKKVIIVPDGWSCSLAECPPGHFMVGDELCLKSEYRTDHGNIEAYCSSGEFFGGGQDCKTEGEREALIVQPVRVEIMEVEGA